MPEKAMLTGELAQKGLPGGSTHAQWLLARFEVLDAEIEVF